MTNPPTEPSAGWYPDPAATASGTLRWWNGTSWSTEVRAAKPVAAPPLSPPPLNPPPAAISAPAIPQAPFAPLPPAAPAAPGFGAPGGYPGGTPSAAPSYADAQAEYLGSPGYAATTGYGASPAAASTTVAAAGAPGYPGYGYGVPLVGPGEPMSFGQAIRSVFRQYAGFGGRASRSEFWYFSLFVSLAAVAMWLLMVIVILVTGATSAVAGEAAVFGASMLTGVIGMTWFAGALAIIVPSWAVTVRRLRDAGQHWAWIFISFVPFGGIVLIVMCCQPAKPWALPRA